MADYSTKTAVFIGRFQPFHTGHLMVVQGMVKSCATVVMAIGSSQESGTDENPFTLDQRKEMIQRALQGVDLIPQYDISLVPVSDVPDDAAWIEHVKQHVGEFDVVWTGNPIVQKLCEEKGVEVKVIKEVPGISGKEIRAKIRAKDLSWTEKVPVEVAEYIKTLEV